MKDVLMHVQPAASGWRIGCDLPLEAAYFRSGARAEQVARDLAARLSGAGHEVRVVIEDRTAQVVATHRYLAR